MSGPGFRHLGGMKVFRALLLPLFALTASMVVLPGSASAGEGHERLAKVCEHIQCSDQQERAIGQVFEQMRIDVKPDREAVRELRGQIAQEWQKDKPDEAKLTKLQDRVASHERNIADRHHEAMMELHDLLDAAQREQIVALLAKHHKKGGKGGKGDKAKAGKAGKSKK